MASLLFHDVYEFFVTNEGIAYFESRPLRLLHAVLIGIGGGAVAVAISRLSPSSQRSLKLIALGCLGVFLIGALGFFAYTLYLSHTAPDITSGHSGLAALVCFSMGVAAGVTGLEFRRVWRQRT